MDDLPTCLKCGQPMRYNVPRLGPDGGFVHAHTYALECQLLDLVRHYIETATPEQVREDLAKANEGWVPPEKRQGASAEDGL